MTFASPPRVPRHAGTLAGAILGAAFFAWIADRRVLDPTSVDWLMKSDWAPHHFGWQYFRAEPWHWPPGAVRGYYAPLGTSIGLTDSIPLAAYALKPFSAWLPASFQYLGPWLLLCFTLQGALAARLIGRRVASPAAQVAGAALFVLLPTLLMRVGHVALCSHWLILWALLLASRQVPRRFQATAWAALGLVAGMVQPYLAAMVLALLGATAVGTRDVAARARFNALGSGLAGTLAGWWLSGVFLLGDVGSFGAAGLGYFSMNLLAFVNPGDWSSVLPALPIASEGQSYEGFHYLGLGVLALAAFARLLVWRTRLAGVSPPVKLWPSLVVVACLAMTAFAISPVITLGSAVVANLDGPWSAPLAPFRVSARFAWPLVYVALTWVVVTVAGRLPGPPGVLTLVAAAALQSVDLQGAHLRLRQRAHDPAFHTWLNPFDDPRWAEIAPGYRHLALVPPPHCGAAPLPYEPAVRLAADYGLSINAGFVARRDEAARAAYCRRLDGLMATATLADDTLYVVAPDAAPVLAARGGPRLACGEIDGVWICSTVAAHARWSSRAGFNRPALP